jgi:hypothetical protein
MKSAVVKQTYWRLRLGWLWGSIANRMSIVDPLNVTPRANLVRIPCVVNAKCDTRLPIVVSFWPPRDAMLMDPYNQPKRKRQYWYMSLAFQAAHGSMSALHLRDPFSAASTASGGAHAGCRLRHAMVRR